MDEASGEIYASFEDGELRGSISFADGDESEFRAVREEMKAHRLSSTIQ